MERVGLRLQLRKQQAEAGDIVLLYGDESEALTHPYLARAWAKSGADLRIPGTGDVGYMDEDGCRPSGRRRARRAARACKDLTGIPHWGFGTKVALGGIALGETNDLRLERVGGPDVSAGREPRDRLALARRVAGA